MEAAAFRRTLGQFASGVTVVTTRDAAAQPLGLTVSAFCSVSLEPPLVLVSIDRRSDANRGLRESRRFAVSVLGEHQYSNVLIPAWNAIMRGMIFSILMVVLVNLVAQGLRAYAKRRFG